VEETRPGEFFPVFEDEQGSYLYNSKDLCMIEHIPELIEAGITSFKIEGRAKTAYYTAVITNAYRSAINGDCSDWVKNEVNCVSHRPYCTGFYLAEELRNESHDAHVDPNNSGYIRDCDFVGVIDDYVPNGVCWVLEITQRNYFTVEDYLEIVSPGVPPERLVFDKMLNSKGETVTVANHAVEKLSLVDCELSNVRQGSMVRRVNKK